MITTVRRRNPAEPATQTKSKWKERIQDVNKDPWDLGYRMPKLEKEPAYPGLESDQLEKIIDILFPTHPEKARKSNK